MYEIILKNENGQVFKKQFDSPYLFKNFLNKVKYSKKLTLISWWKLY